MESIDRVLTPSNLLPTLPFENLVELFQRTPTEDVIPHMLRFPLEFHEFITGRPLLAALNADTPARRMLMFPRRYQASHRTFEDFDRMLACILLAYNGDWDRALYWHTVETYPEVHIDRQVSVLEHKQALDLIVDAATY